MASPPQAVARFPGIVNAIGGTFAFTQGETPSRCVLDIAPQQNPPALIGTLTIVYGSTTITFEDCRAVEASYVRNSSGRIVSLHIEDWRWRWRGGYISGRYNRRDANGKIVSRTQKTPRELAELCLREMGQTKYDVSELPNDTRPAVDWDGDNPAQMLAALCDSLGCRISPTYGNGVRIVRLGQGAELPRGPNVGLTDLNETLDPPETLDGLLLIGGVAEFQNDLLLEAVALEPSGEYVPLDSASYKPAAGWKMAGNGSFAGIADEKLQELAQASVYRCWRPVVARTGLHIAGYTDQTGEKIKRLDQLVLYNRQCEQAVQLGEKKFLPAWLYGSFKPRKAAGNLIGRNTVDLPQPIVNPTDAVAKAMIYRDGFSIDTEKNIITTTYPLTRYDNNRQAEPAILRLRVAVSIRREKEDSLIRFQREREYRSPTSTRTKPKIIRRDDIQVRSIPTYVGTNYAIKSIAYNDTELNKESDYYLDLEEATWRNAQPSEATYAHIIPMELDGAIRAVVWRWGGGSYGSTRVSRNNEPEYFVTPYAERRLTAKINEIAKDKGKPAN